VEIVVVVDLLALGFGRGRVEGGIVLGWRWEGIQIGVRR